VNIKRGLKRLGVVLSVYYLLEVLVSIRSHKSLKFFGFEILSGRGYYGDPLELIVAVTVFILGVFWGLLYIGFWVGSGFSGGDKKEGKTDE
jgi:hypothetical protein